ncbi:hypothetical protein AB0K18_26055 [Nonomuraea sp. NPDC049421]|uniref:hypothetical protein n=1 Tax=Nonomuraea sp. NPDC049421 TaxID=3155275 RepID=UPI003412A55D
MSREQLVEEALRCRNSVLSVMFRYPREDVRVAGTAIRAGEPIAVALSAAGADPARYGGDAAAFDASREPDAHLGARPPDRLSPRAARRRRG